MIFLLLWALIATATLISVVFAYANAREEIADLRVQMAELQEEAMEEAQQYLKKREKDIRKDAAKRSKAVNRGQMLETMAPYLPDFLHNPKDCRFLGSPIDFVVFEGSTDGEISSVILVEVKTGRSRLNKHQRQVRDCIKEGHVTFEEVHVETQ